MRWVLHISMVLLGGLIPLSGLVAQEHPYITEYTLTEQSGGISVDWTLQGGSTCNGQDIERSIDGENFEAVHRILGICGDPTVAVSFSWFDNAPPEFSTVHYRVKLGFDGYTSIKTVDYGQLVSSDQRFFPSPMRENATLLLKVPLGTLVQLEIFDASGKLVVQRQNLSGPAIGLSLPNLRGGVYNYRARGDSKVFIGRFAKE